MSIVGIELQNTIKAFKDLKLPIVRTKNKAPIINGWQKLSEDVEGWGGNLTTATEAGFVITSDIVVVDVDPRNFNSNVDSLEELSKAIDFDLKTNAKFATRTASGGFHLYYKKRADVKFPNESDKFKGVEFKQKGQQVILPNSTLPDGRKYILMEGLLGELTEIPQKFYEIIGTKASSKAVDTGVGFKNHTADILRLRQLLDKTPPAMEGEHGDQATYNVCCLGKDYGLSPDVFFELLLEWNERCSPPWDAGALRAKMLNAYSYSHNKAGSHSVEAMFSAIEQSFLSSEDAKKQEETLIDWQNELQVSKNGGYKTTLKNAVLFMKHDEHLKGKIAFNEFSHKKFWMEETFWITNGRREWTDEDAIQIRYIFNNNNFDVGTNLVEEASVIVSSNNRFHPVKHWFENNCEWDKKPRLDNFFHEYCGTELNKYTSALARKIFCAVVARIYNPGCKFDMVPIFVGERGIGKSSLIELIAIKKEWFCNNVGDITDAKELVPQSNGKLIIEWQELSMYNKLDINSVKSFASTQVDRVRRAHARNSEDYPRQFIVIATTNQDKFLLDETGERRITPIELKKVDLESVKKDIPQLYAEAKELYIKGEKLYFDESDVINMYAEECDKRFRNDEIEDSIAEWLENIPAEIEHICTKDKLQINDVIIHCLKESPTKSRGLANRVANVLRRLGYQRQSYRMEGKVKQGFVKKV